MELLLAVLLLCKSLIQLILVVRTFVCVLDEINLYITYLTILVIRIVLLESLLECVVCRLNDWKKETGRPDHE